MGSQQILLYTLGIIMILIVVALVMLLFREHQISSNKDAIIIDLKMIAADLEQYTLRPATMGGGDGSYDGYAIPGRFTSNLNGTYSVTLLSSAHPGKHGHGHAYGHEKNGETLQITGVSALGFGTISLTIADSTSNQPLSFSGAF